MRSKDRRIRWMIGAHLFWLLLVCSLGAWWGRLLLSQAELIAKLEANQNQLHHTQRMLYWESPVFFGLLFACTGLLFWLYWADVKRARGLQAFFASVTHELRTPLTSIRLQAESIAENLAEQNTERNLVQRLLEDTVRLESQVERTLELARLEGGGPVYTQAVELKPWLERFVQSWNSAQNSVGHKVEFELLVQDIVVDADPTALQIIFRNLFENSVRHSATEAQIRIDIRMTAPSALMIHDTGQGFTGNPNTLGELFQKGPHSPGTGVGLYLVNTLMKKMGGSARFTAHSGFTVHLAFREALQSHHE